MGSGSVEVRVDYGAQAAGHDFRDWVQISIDALEASIQGRASMTQLTQKINGTEVQHMDLTQQLAALKELKVIQLAPTILKTGGNVLKARF